LPCALPWFTNRQAMMTITPDSLAWRTFQEHINECPIRSVTDAWASRGAFGSCLPWFMPGSQTQIKGGLLYGARPQAPWALGPSLAIDYMTLSPFWIFSLDLNALRPNLCPRAEMRLRHPRYPKQAPPNRLQPGRRCYCSELPCTQLSGSAFGNIATKRAFGGGNQFQCHYHISRRNIHLEMIELDPYSH